MLIRDFLDTLPLWAIFLGTLALMMAATEAGYRVGHRKNEHGGSEEDTRINAMTGAHLGLLAFILAFTFNLAAGHYSDRKKLVLAEVNAIETAWLRAQLVDQGVGIEVQRLLRDYARNRAVMRHDVRDLQRRIAFSNQLQAAIWEQIDRLSKLPGFTARESLLVSAVNELFDLQEKRIYAALYDRIPASIWTMLYVILSLSMFGLGYFSGMRGHRNFVIRSSFTLSLTMMMLLIADLDRPMGGLVLGDQSVMVEYSRELQARELPPPG